jgi:HSP20 family molecular chaperone IbpA
MPLYLGDAKLSTKWRRSPKHLRWIDLTSAKDHSKILHVAALRAARNIYPPYYRSSKDFAKRKWKNPKPLIDIFQEKNWITIVAEIAGFNKETLKINVKDQKLTLSANSKRRPHHLQKRRARNQTKKSTKRKNIEQKKLERKCPIKKEKQEKCAAAEHTATAE